MKYSDLAVVILAAGKGKRLKSQTINKVILPLAGKPMILYTLDWIKKLGIKNIYIVVGYQKQSIVTICGKDPTYVEQKSLLGTAHATLQAVKVIPKKIKDIVVVYGDHSFFYTPKIINQLINQHRHHHSSMSLLTIITDKHFKYGRLLRNKKGNLLGIVEERDATPAQRKIKELNLGCYCFSVNFLKKYLPQVKKSPVTGEYYLPDLAGIAVKNKQKICTIQVKDDKLGLGINTFKQLLEGDELMRKSLNYES